MPGNVRRGGQEAGKVPLQLKQIAYCILECMRVSQETLLLLEV